MFRRLGAFVRSALDRAGYVLVKKDFTRFGYSLFTDIKRISRDWDWSIDVVFDVGANTGQFAGEALAGFPDARIYSFEPFPRSFERLIAAHSDSRFSAHDVAMCDKVGPADFFVYGDSGESSHINSLVADAQYPEKFGYSPRKDQVAGCTIDAFCSEYGIERIDLLKIDTEGSELQVLHGAESMLSGGHVHFVYTEFNSYFQKPSATGGALIPIAEYLAQFGFEYMITYTDYVMQDRQLCVCANALFAKPVEPDLAASL